MRVWTPVRHASHEWSWCVISFIGISLPEAELSAYSTMQLILRIGATKCKATP
jgi:hypothetical protein